MGSLLVFYRDSLADSAASQDLGAVEQVSALRRGQRVRVCQLILSDYVELRPAGRVCRVGLRAGSGLYLLELGLALGAAGGLVAV